MYASSRIAINMYNVQEITSEIEKHAGHLLSLTLSHLQFSIPYSSHSRLTPCSGENFMPRIQRFVNLLRLDLSSTDISGAKVDEFTLQNLTELNISACSQIRDIYEMLR